MTRIIFHGGNANIKTDKNARFYREIIAGIDKDSVSVLCIYFARPETRWADSYAEDEAAFRVASSAIGRKVETKLASYDMDELLAEMAAADVIFINGGYNGHLKETLLAIGVDRFRELIQDKTLVGISAGANMLAKYYYSYAIAGIREGIGLLNIKALTHAEDKAQALDLLQNYKEELPIVKVAEEEYVTIAS